MNAKTSRNFSRRPSKNSNGKSLKIHTLRNHNNERIVTATRSDSEHSEQVTQVSLRYDNEGIAHLWAANAFNHRPLTLKARCTFAEALVRLVELELAVTDQHANEVRNERLAIAI